MKDRTVTLKLNVSAAGRKGGPARAKSLTSEQRKQIASDAAKAKWKKFYRDNPGKRKKKANAKES